SHTNQPATNPTACSQPGAPVQLRSAEKTRTPTNASTTRSPEPTFSCRAIVRRTHAPILRRFIQLASAHLRGNLILGRLAKGGAGRAEPNVEPLPVRECHPSTPPTTPCGHFLVVTMT